MPSSSSETHHSADTLVPLVYDELRRLAHRQRYRAPLPRRALTTTALVHEAYLKLQAQTSYDGEQHMLAVAATAMRQLLVDEARRRMAEKRGAGRPARSLDDADPPDLLGEEQVEMVLEVDRALAELGETEERLRRVVECRFFAGLTLEETAKALRLTARTINRDWSQARGWLRDRLEELDPS